VWRLSAARGADVKLGVNKYSAIFLAIIVSGCSSVVEPLDDNWEIGEPKEAYQFCWEVPTAWILRVDELYRAEAILMLQNQMSAEISEINAAELTQIEPTLDGNIPRNLLERSISELLETKRNAYDQNIGGFSRADQKYLDQLQDLYATSRPDEVRPYLVRAIAKHEFTGGFEAQHCDQDLIVIHTSLGTSVPKSTKLPIVVFLLDRPDTVYPLWFIAE
jgi:hypothetical protein